MVVIIPDEPPTGAWKTQKVEDIPDAMEPSTIYVVGSPPWAVVFLCPCGCQGRVNLSLLGSHPRWTLEEHEDGTITMSPSINWTTGCKSHFWLRRSRIEAC